MDENELGSLIVDSRFQVHKALGPGLLESVYKLTLEHELQSRGLHVEREVPISIRYKQLGFDEAFRADLRVERKVIIELKSEEQIHPVHHKQLLTYLRLTECKLGY